MQTEAEMTNEEKQRKQDKRREAYQQNKTKKGHKIGSYMQTCNQNKRKLEYNKLQLAKS